MDDLGTVIRELAAHSIRVLPDGHVSILGNRTAKEERMSVKLAAAHLRANAAKNEAYLMRIWKQASDLLSERGRFPSNDTTRRLFIAAVKHLCKQSMASDVLKSGGVYEGFREACRADTTAFSNETMSRLIDFRLAIDWMSHLVAYDEYRAELVDVLGVLRERGASKTAQSEANKPSPSVLYHHSAAENRESILKSGLLASMDRTGDDNSVKGIYLIDRPTLEGGDVWQVNVQGLELDEDVAWGYTGVEGESYVFYGDIPPNRLKLVQPAGGIGPKTAAAFNRDYSTPSESSIPWEQYADRLVGQSKQKSEQEQDRQRLIDEALKDQGGQGTLIDEYDEIAHGINFRKRMNGTKLKMRQENQIDIDHRGMEFGARPWGSQDLNPHEKSISRR